MRFKRKLKRSEKHVMKSKKVILDTNVWISHLISNRFIFLDELIENGRITLIFSEELIEEFIEVAARPKFKDFFTEKDIEKLIENFDFYGKMVKVTSHVEKCRDEKDNFLLNLAIDSNADYLVTGDNDLLVLGMIEKTKILKVKEMADIFRE